MGDIPAELVPNYYEMDPGTDDLLFSGEALMNGMVVLQAYMDRRVDLKPPGKWFGSRKLTKVELFQARIENRWCRVTDLSIVGHHLQFLAIYADGTKYVRSYNALRPWLVKLSSLEDLTR